MLIGAFYSFVEAPVSGCSSDNKLTLAEHRANVGHCIFVKYHIISVMGYFRSWFMRGQEVEGTCYCLMSDQLSPSKQGN